MIRPDVRINAILSESNFNAIAAYCFENATKELVIPIDQLRKIAFSSYSSKNSETECEMMIRSSFRLPNLVQELRESVDDCVVQSFSGLKIKPESYVKWKKLIFLNGQDIFISSLEKISQINWPYALPMESNYLDVSLKDGYAENHLHFSAAWPAFDVNWILLHNGTPVTAPLRLLQTKGYAFFSKYYDKSTYYRFENIALLAIYLRRFLYSRYRFGNVKSKDRIFIKGITFENLSSKQSHYYNYLMKKIEGIYIRSSNNKKILWDYAIPRICDNPLFGERDLLRNVCKAYSSWSNKDRAHFYLYLICKRYIASFFVQNNNYYGFKNFKRFERAVELFVPDNSTKLREEINHLAFEAIEQSPKLKQAEIRIAPKQSASVLSRRIASLNPNSKKGIRYRLVIHFIKETETVEKSLKQVRPGMVAPRSYALLNKYERETQAIKKIVLLQRKGCRLPIVGVDAANEEISCRAEVFAPFYRDLRYCMPIHPDGKRKRLGLHFTFHAGEDFVTLTDGLRAIDEAIEFLELSNGDRIGHASALGTDVTKYHALKGDKILQTKQDYLDDCCYLYRSLIGINDFEGERSKLYDEIQRYVTEIYGPAPVASYMKSIFLRADHPDVHRLINKANTYHIVKRRFALSGKPAYLKHAFNGDYQSGWLDEASLRLIHLYHYSSAVRSKGAERVEITLTEDDKRAIEFAQRALLSKFLDRNIGVETNPTSNYRIGPFDDFEDIPALSMVGVCPGKEHYHGLRLSIGTDDPGLFGISLHNEYGSILYSLQQHVRGNDLLEEMQRLAKMSLELSFDD